MRRLLVFAAFLAILTPFAVAQHHGTMSMGSRSMPARPAAIGSPFINHFAPAGIAHVSSPVQLATRVMTTHTRTGGTIVRVTRPANVVRRRIVNDDDFDFLQDDSSFAPGLGFDETHFFATRGRRHRRNIFNSGFFPFFDGGGFIFPTPIVVEQAPQAEVQEEIVEPNTQERTQRVRSRESAPVYSAETTPAPTPQPETENSEQYVFVRRDGTVFFAVAYSWDSGILRYITQDGFRRSITGNALDLGATQQFNEQRGLSFHAPA